MQSRFISLLVGGGYICLKLLLREIWNLVSTIWFDIWIFQNKSAPDVSWAIKARGLLSLAINNSITILLLP